MMSASRLLPFGFMEIRSWSGKALVGSGNPALPVLAEREEARRRVRNAVSGRKGSRECAERLPGPSEDAWTGFQGGEPGEELPPGRAEGGPRSAETGGERSLPGESRGEACSLVRLKAPGGCGRMERLPRGAQAALGVQGCPLANEQPVHQGAKRRLRGLFSE